MPDSGYVIAFDFGLRHIGVAVGQPITGTASGLATLNAHRGEPDWEALTRLVGQWQPTQLVVGLPLNMDDSESEMSTAARGFADALQTQTAIPVALVDERLTSFAARELSDEHNHEVAAVLIAESWLGSSAGR